MLQKVRWRLTFINITVIGSIVLLFSLAIYWKSPRNHDALFPLLYKSLPLLLITLLLVFLGSWFIAGKALVPARKAWQRQIDFTADASHELRTPITVIQTNLELVLGNPEETVESQKKWLDNIFMENKRMTHLVNDLLMLSRADANEHPFSLVWMDLDQVLLEALIPFEPHAANADVTLVFDLEPNTYCWGDPEKLKQLIIILMDNALRYTDRSGQITVQMVKKDKTVELSVADSGVGIEAEHLEKIFDRFYRVDKARSRDGGGSGLGLAIAKWIVTKHHGHIRAVSSPGEGTAFQITLPVVRT
ncbi:ATP-binding protein [Paenibacillus sp. FSL R7-0204]|uniref:sensor histidine kinase n=1 Tax=Paenibacillus sp. FSL R7-0204 TaxID=2921675 RepID=UPI0030F83E8F